MKAYCLASSSSGNCYILEFVIKGISTRIMVECGIPISEIYKRSAQYGIDISSIECCLITHAHGDHCCAARRLHLPLFAHSATLSRIGVPGGVLVDFKPRTVCEGIKVMSFPVEHDIDGAVGFVIKTLSECVIFVNDHKRWTCNLSNFKPDYVFIECNYDHKMVYAQLHDLENIKRDTLLSSEEIKDVNNKIAQHKRNLESHCSLHGTIAGLKKLNLQKCQSIFLMHLSDRHANEYRMKNEVQLETHVSTFVCGKLGGIK